MVQKKQGVVLLLIGIFLFNIFVFWKLDNSVIGALFSFNLHPPSIKLLLILFIAQWLVLVYIAAMYKILTKRREKAREQFKKMLAEMKNKVEGKKVVNKKVGTQIDDFHTLLLERGIVKVSEVAKHFKLTKDLAMNWAKILEDHKMAKIEYPAFGEPEIQAYMKEMEKKEDGKEKK